jgi:hypothetical protein
MSRRPNKSLQATGATPSVLDGVGDSLLPGFVATSFPAPVPELGRSPHKGPDQVPRNPQVLVTVPYTRPNPGVGVLIRPSGGRMR